MKLKIWTTTISIIILCSCVSIPKETVQLSKVLGNDLAVLHNSHRKMVDLYYDKMENDINTFIDEVYSPFIIHYVLNEEYKKFKNGEESLYEDIEVAGKSDDMAEAKKALNTLTEFMEDANYQIEKKRKELQNPILKQKKEIIDAINKSYETAIYANSTITGYLESIRKVKESQQETLKVIGLEGKDEELNNILLKASETINYAIDKGKEIDVRSENALNEIEEISNIIKEITNKNK